MARRPSSPLEFGFGSTARRTAVSPACLMHRAPGGRSLAEMAGHRAHVDTEEGGPDASSAPSSRGPVDGRHGFDSSRGDRIAGPARQRDATIRPCPWVDGKRGSAAGAAAAWS